MSGYVEAGYLIVTGTLSSYTVVLLRMSAKTKQRLAHVESVRSGEIVR
ncbi:MAG: hypothetical protein ACYDHP_09365 [Ferrimicrobium sp.]